MDPAKLAAFSLTPIDVNDALTVRMSIFRQEN